MTMAFANLYKDILSNIDELIYVVELNSMKTIYISPKLKRYLPDYDKNETCYKNLTGKDAPCIQCPRNFLSEENRKLSMDMHCDLFNETTNYKYLYYEQDETPYLTVILSPEKGKSHEEDTRRDEMCRVLISITKMLSLDKDIFLRLSECLSSVADFYSASGCYFYQIERNLTYKSITAKNDESITLGDKEISNEWRAGFEKERIVRFDQNSEFGYTGKQMAMQGIKNIIAASVKRYGEIVGYLYVTDPKENQDFTVLLSSVAPFIENEFEEEDRTNKLDMLAYTDLMTGLKNRTCYNDMIKTLETRNNSIGIIFVDINGLKQGNDTYGHEYGDKMIKTVADELKQFFEETIYRIGGDEFVVFLPGTDEYTFQKQVDNYKRNRSTEVPVSIGSKWFDSSGNCEKKISEVDQLMYAEKENYYKTHDRRKRRAE